MDNQDLRIPSFYANIFCGHPLSRIKLFWYWPNFKDGFLGSKEKIHNGLDHQYPIFFSGECPKIGGKDSALIHSILTFSQNRNRVRAVINSPKKSIFGRIQFGVWTFSPVQPMHPQNSNISRTDEWTSLVSWWFTKILCNCHFMVKIYRKRFWQKVKIEWMRAESSPLTLRHSPLKNIGYWWSKSF